jgi:hypothetical protein
MITAEVGALYIPTINKEGTMLWGTSPFSFHRISSLIHLTPLT